MTFDQWSTLISGRQSYQKNCSHRITLRPSKSLGIYFQMSLNLIISQMILYLSEKQMRRKNYMSSYKTRKQETYIYFYYHWKAYNVYKNTESLAIIVQQFTHRHPIQICKRCKINEWKE